MYIQIQQGLLSSKLTALVHQCAREPTWHCVQMALVSTTPALDRQALDNSCCLQCPPFHTVRGIPTRLFLELSVVRTLYSLQVCTLLGSLLDSFAQTHPFRLGQQL